MAGEKLKLDTDLAAKLDRLRWMREQPQLFLSEYFASIRNEIDYDTERLIQNLADNSAESDQSAWTLNKLNQTRDIFIQFLDRFELSLSKKLLVASSVPISSEVFIGLEKRFEEFTAMSESLDVNQLEDVYLKLALDIIDATNALERLLFGNQTFSYKPSFDKCKLGNLIYLSEDYLNHSERCCLKSDSGSVRFSARFVYQDIQAFLNSSLAVPLNQPFILTKNMLILTAILRFFKADVLEKIILYPENIEKTMEDKNREICTSLPKMDLFAGFDYESGAFVEELQFTDLTPYSSAPILLELTDNRVRRFEIGNSLMMSLTKLGLNDNQLEELNEDLLAKGTNLDCLKLLDACLPGTNFSIDFLSSLTKLSHLELTLPHASVDLGVFKNLTNMNSITLHSAASLDLNIERPKLTDEHCELLSRMPSLTSLALSHFEIDTLQWSKLTKLNWLYLTNNNIRKVNVDNVADSAESDQRSKCFFLNLSQNRIVQLPRELLAELTSLEYLYLEQNLIQTIDRGVFKKLTRLLSIRMNKNPVDSIEVGAFEGLTELRELLLKNCRLKSVDSEIFEDLEGLNVLSFDWNQIESFRVTTENGETFIRGILSSAEYDLVKQNLFSGMKNLSKLGLKGNKLEKMDLNLFCNLTFLQELDLSDNQINQLNDEIRPGVLSCLLELDLSNNQLTRIGRHAFSESIYLAGLILSGNKLESLAENFFEQFERLTRLNLQSNYLTMDITERTFRNQIRSLYNINLLENPAVRIADGSFNQFTGLKIVQLQSTKADSQTIEKFIQNRENISFLSRVEILSIINSSLKSLECFTMKFKSLEELDLSRNGISSITQACLSNLHGLKLLNVSGNLIESFDDPAVFQGLTLLRKLNISSNNLRRIHRSVFKSLQKLESLDMSNNPTLSNIDCGIFRSLFSLKRLNLAGNNIASLDIPLLFRSCRLLECLNLSNNQLDHESINEESMSGSTAQNLKELMLANNRLEKIEFVCVLYRLEKLDLSGNMIEDLTLSSGLNWLGRLVKLKHIHLSGNRMKSNALHFSTVL